MIGGIIERVVHLGPDGHRIDPEDGPVFPHSIKLVVKEARKSTGAPTGERCAVHVAPCNYNIEPGDKCWWQAGSVYWTKPNSRLSDVPLQKVGFTYSGESLDLP